MVLRIEPLEEKIAPVLHWVDDCEDKLGSVSNGKSAPENDVDTTDMNGGKVCIPQD